jgi:transcriptional regulator with XRE-family HTH domain
MSVRPLRTTAVQKPTTQGERIRFARIACNLSQPQLARAVSQISKSKVTKSLVSQWERDSVANPNNANMLAIQAVTGHSLEWLVSGRGPQKVSLPKATADSSAPLDAQRLARCFLAVNPALEMPLEKARTVAALYDLLGDTPDMSTVTLQRLAATLLAPR